MIKNFCDECGKETETLYYLDLVLVAQPNATPATGLGALMDKIQKPKEERLLTRDVCRLCAVAIKDKVAEKHKK